MPSKFNHFLDPMPNLGAPNKTLTFSFDTAVSGGHSNLANTAARHIEQAREDINTSITILNGTPNVAKKHLESFFFCEPADAKKIVAKLQLILTGLKGNQRIKIGTIPMSDTGTAAGAVKVVQKLSLLAQPRDYYNTLDGVTYGAIYLDPDSVRDEAGPRLVIHEASHKFAGTSDYFYFDPVGLRGDFSLTPTKLFKKPMKEIQALDNADSYAWLCHKLAAFGF